MRTKCWSENPKGRDHAEDLRVDGSIILERILGTRDRKMWIGFMWLRIGTGAGILCTR